MKKGKSIKEVKRNTGRSIGTIQRFANIIKGVQSYDSLRIPDDENIIGEFFGIFSGDGSFFFDPKSYHYTFQIHLGKGADEEYAEWIIEMLRQHFSKKIRKYYHGNRIRLMFYSKTLYVYMKDHLELENKTYSIKLRKGIWRYSDVFLKSFVRGLMDTDGSVQRYRIFLKLASKELIEQIHDILNSLGIENRFQEISDPRLNCNTLYSITINKSQFRKYSSIGFSNPRKREIFLNALGGS